MKINSIINNKKTLGMLFFLIAFLEFQGHFDYYKRPSDYLYYFTSYKSDLEKIQKKYDLDIEFSINKVDYPKDWTDLLEEKNDITSLEDKVKRAKVLGSLIDGLDLYPKDIFMHNVDNLYMLDHIVIGGTKVGATYNLNDNSIYLSTNNDSNTIIVKNLHHEFSSILIKKYDFSEKYWRKAAGKGFKYEQDKNRLYRWLFLGGEVDRIDQETLLNRGLLRQYAETGVENDFNIYAEYVFSYPSKMKTLISDFPIIKRKYEVFRAFYLGIDEGFQPVFDKIDS